MTYVVCATWKARPGEESAVLELLRRVSAASTQEQDCLVFQVHRSVTEPGLCFLYEQYVSEAAFQTHAATNHVRDLILGDAVHRLESRRRELYETV